MTGKKSSRKRKRGCVSSGGEREGVRGRGRERMGRKGMRSDRGVQMKRSRDAEPYL